MTLPQTSHRSLIRVVLITTILASPLPSTQTIYAQEIDKDKAINNALAKTVAKENLPGMITAIISSEGVMAIGTAGVRKIGSDKKLTDKDLIHIGSCTKAMPFMYST